MQVVDTFYEEFGARVRRARQQAGVSQEQLGHLVGLNRSSISNVEIGRQRVPLHMLMEFANALEVPAGSLLPTAPSESDPLRGVPAESRSFVEDVLNTAAGSARG
jgi:transcriptional regulator with XRE-family HTH domain